MEFGSRSGLTPVSGVLRIPDLPNADYDVTVHADGYQPVVTRVRVGPGMRAHTVALTPLRGRLEVVTSPGATVSAVDGDGNETPLGVADTQGRLTSDNVLRAGRHTVRLEADGRESVEAAVEVAAGRTSKITRQLPPMPGEIRIISVPSGAEIRVNGVASGTTPATLRDLPAEQPLRIAAFLDGYRSVEQEVTLKPQERRTLNLGTLPAESGALSLRFTTDEDLDIDDVTVTIDGQKRQPDPEIDDWEVRSFAGLKTGRHSLRVSHPDYETWTKAVEVSGEGEPMVEVSLVPKPGTVAFVSTPAGAQVVVESEGGSAATRVDSQIFGRSVTPLRRTLPAGDYNVRFSLDGYGDEERSVHVAPNQTVEVTVDLEKLFAEEHDLWPGPQSELVRFDHWNGLISFSYPQHWMAQPPVMQMGNTYTVSDIATQTGAQVYEVPGTNQPPVAVKLIAQTLGQYGAQVSVHETRAYGSAVFFKGTTVGGGSHVTWVGLFHAVPGGVIGLTVGCPSANFGDNQALFNQILGTVRFPQ